MENILVVFTGGTIGSRIQGHSISVGKENRYLLLKEYEAKYPGSVHFETAEPFWMLSENFKPAHMEELVRFLKECNIQNYDGVIVTHGTDSLPYTAAFLGYYFASAQLPILLVSSNYVLGEAGSNGAANFEAAVDFIREGRYAGVFVPFRNRETEPVSLFLATRLLEADGYEDKFFSFDGGRLGRIEQGRFFYEKYKANPPLEAFLKNADRRADRNQELQESRVHVSPGVLKLHSYPGLAYDTIKLDDGIKAVFHGTYHSGTVCMQGERENAGLFVKRAAKKNIPVYFGSVKRQENQYEAVREMLSAGGIPVYDCSEIAAYEKLLIGCSLGKQGAQLEAFMKKNIYFEQIERSGEAPFYEKEGQ